MTQHDAPWLFLVIAWPLLLAALAWVPALRDRSLSWLPLAPLPALAAALLAPVDATGFAADLLLGSLLTLGGVGRMFLGGAAFLWLVAGWFARSQLSQDARRTGFVSVWCLTLAGNLGVVLAADVVTFYVSFACVSLAAYPLVVHSRQPKALRAGLVYLVLALIGEICLLLGFMLAVEGATSLWIADVREAIPDSPWQGAILALLVAGFGIKAGLVPLHVWLPLAHPAAPTAASAVLSGAIVKAGIVGLIQFLPLGLPLPGWQEALLVAGLFTAFYGVAMGLAQHNAKAVLAYSTVSQMGLIVVILAAALQAGPPTAAVTAASFYALHHGLTKGALFLGVGVVAASGRRALPLVLALLALPALSLAGFPLTSGALAKLEAKPVLGEGGVEWLFTLSAVGTALLMMRFLWRVADSTAPEPDARAAPGLRWPWLAAVFTCFVVPWLLFPGISGQSALYPLLPGNLLGAAWPVALAAVVAALVLAARLRAPTIPEGDLLVPVTAFGRHLWCRRPSWSGAKALPQMPDYRTAAEDWVAVWTGRVERLLSRWSISGVLLLGMIVLAAL